MSTIKIKMFDSEDIKWTGSSWDDYSYDGKFFIVKKDGAWVGMYNLDYIISIMVI